MKRVIFAIACGIIAAGCEPTEQYNPQSNSKEERTEQNCARATAEIMGIPWNTEDGTTVKLNEFNRRVKECMNG